MVVAIMQPYFFPYIGYFQLMHAVDLFVFYDDVQYIDRGWVNRNKIMLAGEARWLTFPVVNAGRHLKINERRYVHDPEAIASLARKVRAGYGGAPCFDATFGLFTEALDFADRNVASLNANLLRRVGSLLGTTCEWAMSSGFGVSADMKGQDRIIALCKVVGATKYINPVNGSSLYSQDAFAREGIDLSFLRTRVAPESPGAEHLSILDGLMRIGATGCRRLLGEYDVVRGEPSGPA